MTTRVLVLAVLMLVCLNLTSAEGPLPGKHKQLIKYRLYSHVYIGHCFTENTECYGFSLEVDDYDACCHGNIPPRFDIGHRRSFEYFREPGILGVCIECSKTS